MKKIILPILFVLFAGMATSQTVVLTPVDDNTLYENGTGALSNGAGDDMFVGRIATGARRRALVKFDVGASIPAGATITAVSLQLTMNQTIAGATTVNLHTVDSDWGEGTSVALSGGGSGAASTTNDATWIHRFFSTSSWTTAGGDFNPVSSASTSVAGNGNYNWSSAQMIADVQFWLDNPGTDFGWIVIGNEAANTTAKRFATKEVVTSANRPRLTVTYTVPCIDPTISNFTASQSAICSGANTQLTVTGSLNSATSWQLYSTSCGSTPVATNATGIFNVTPTVATTYFVRGIGGCVTPGTCTSTTITILPNDDPSFSYTNTSYCSNEPNETAIITGTTGGTFSSTAGLSLNSSTGEINFATSTAGNYTVFYTTPGVSCVASTNQPITIYPQHNINTNASICNGDSYVFGSQTLNTAGTFNELFQSVFGCDSMVTLTLATNPVYTINTSAAICNGDDYSFGSQTLNAPGVYNEMFQSVNGCDSLVNLTLSITVVDTSVLYASFTLTANESNGVFQWIDCDNNNSPVTGETNVAFSPAANGNYALIITHNGCTDTSYCHNVTGIGVNEYSETNLVKIYPNPANTQLSLYVNIAGETYFTLFNMQGQTMLQQTINASVTNIDIAHLPTGIYSAFIQSGSVQAIRKVVIE